MRDTTDARLVHAGRLVQCVPASVILRHCGFCCSVQFSSVQFSSVRDALNRDAKHGDPGAEHGAKCCQVDRTNKCPILHCQHDSSSVLFADMFD